jgi:hypothetical protein
VLIVIGLMLSTLIISAASPPATRRPQYHQAGLRLAGHMDEAVIFDADESTGY